MSTLLFALYTILSGAQQGIITWLFREYVPLARKDWIHAALHYGGVLIYLLIVGYVAYCRTSMSISGWGILLVEASLSRALLFDPCLNLAQSWFNHRERRPAEPLFKVGTVAMLDRGLRWLAGKLGMEPAHLRLTVWVVSLAGAGLLLATYN